jgi:hypothetical protein
MSALGSAQATSAAPEMTAPASGDGGAIDTDTTTTDGRRRSFMMVGS